MVSAAEQLGSEMAILWPVSFNKNKLHTELRVTGTGDLPLNRESPV